MLPCHCHKHAPIDLSVTTDFTGSSFLLKPPQGPSRLSRWTREHLASGAREKSKKTSLSTTWWRKTSRINISSH